MIEFNDHLNRKLSKEDKEGIIKFYEEIDEKEQIEITSIIIYGSAARYDFRPGKSDLNLMIIVKWINVPVLKAFLDPVYHGRRYGISPFFLTKENLYLAADAFPVKYLNIKEDYFVLLGEDCLKDIKIKTNYLKFRCLQETRNLLLHLRRNYLRGGGGGRSLTEIMSRTIGTFIETLRILLSLNQEKLLDRSKVIMAASKSFKIDEAILNKLMSLRDVSSPLQKDKAEELYDDYMAIVDDVAQQTYKM